jgi:hypothetical protein
MPLVDPVTIATRPSSDLCSAIIDAGVGISIDILPVFEGDFVDVREVPEMPFVHGLHADIRLGRRSTHP